jgi:hypothetical protein
MEEGGDEGKLPEQYEQKQASSPSTFGDLLKAAAEDQEENESDK